jgi:hypothetical protein
MFGSLHQLAMETNLSLFQKIFQNILERVIAAYFDYLLRGRFRPYCSKLFLVISRAVTIFEQVILCININVLVMARVVLIPSH